MKRYLKFQILLLIFFLVGLIFIHQHIPQRREYPPIFSKEFPLSTPLSFWASMLGMRRLATDIVWIQTMQYYGQPEGKAYELGKNGDLATEKVFYPELKQYWQQIIRFDPYFISAYMIAPTTLAWNLQRYEEAFEILDESINTVEHLQQQLKTFNIIETDPKHLLILGSHSYFEELKWKLYILKSSLIYMREDDYKSAIYEFEKIVFNKDVPEELKIILAQLYEKNGDYKKAVTLWERLYQTSSRKNRQKKALKNIERINELIFSD